MRPRPRLAMIAALPLLLAPAPAAAAWPTSPYTNLPICTATGSQVLAETIADGAGGFYVCWDDLRSGEFRVYLQHVLADGQVAPGWPVDGLRLSNAGVARFGEMVLGPSGSVYVAWNDARADATTFDIYVTRVESNGTFGVGWPVDGRQLSNVPGKSEVVPRIATDGAGGAYVSWRLDYSSSDHDVYVSRVLPNSSVAAGISPGGDPLCTLTSEQMNPTIVADGLGNAVVVWEDNRTLGGTVFDVYAQKQLANGTQAWVSQGVPVTTIGSTERAKDPCVRSTTAGATVVAYALEGPSSYSVMIQLVNASGVPQWGSSGVPVATSTALAHVDLASDGAGGWIAAWEDYRSSLFTPAIYAARILSTGSPTWTMHGVKAVDTSDYATFPRLVSDGAGGAIVTWAGTVSPGAHFNIHGQRFGPGGQRMWGAEGAAVSLAGPGQSRPSVCSDLSGGAFIAWYDNRSQTTPYDIYAQRVDRFGALGDATPAITRIADVPNDQGGFASLQWSASYLDNDADRVVRTYSLWRRVPGGVPPAARAGAAPVLADAAPTPERGPAYRTSVEGDLVVFWEYLTSKPAGALPGYSAVVATTSDSMPGGNPRTSFRVRAETIDGAMYWDSAPDSGYSVDNLAPAQPAPFNGTYANGRSSLQWGSNAEPDLAGYRLHRGTTSGFVPGAGNLVAETAGNAWVDDAGVPYWYKLGAVDAHGNVGPYATVLPSGALGAPGTRLPVAFALSPVAPNPSRGPVDVAFAMPGATRVTIALYDAAGRRVRELLAEDREAGEHAVRWDGRDEAGAPAAAGLYFIRMEAGTFRAERRLVRIP